MIELANMAAVLTSFAVLLIISPLIIKGSIKVWRYIDRFMQRVDDNLRNESLKRQQYRDAWTKERNNDQNP